MMLVSIVIPVYNRAQIVKRTLQSVLEQTHRPLQVILVDNCSNDDTLLVLKDFQATCRDQNFTVEVAQEERHTAAAARNKGLAMATGKWVMFFDSDDVMHPTLIDTYVKAIEKAQDAVDIVVTKGKICFQDGRSRTLPYFHKDIMANHILHCILPTQRYIVRRDFFISCGRWNADILKWDDWETGLRLLLAKPRIKFIDKSLVTVFDSGRESITGIEFSPCHKEWERTIDVMSEMMERTSIEGKSRFLTLLDFRRVLLAAHYEKEGRRDLARQLYQATYPKFKGKPLQRQLIPLFYRYTAQGRRGAARLARFLIG